MNALSYFFRKVTAVVVPVLFIAAGVFLIIMGFRNSKARKIYIDNTAVIVTITRELEAEDYNYEVYVKHTVDGKEYTTPLGFYSDGMKEGQEIAIKYDPADPYTVIPAKGSQTVIFFVSGIVAILLGAVSVLKSLKGF